MATTTKVAFRALGVTAAVFFFATCTQDREPLEPDVRATLPQTAGAAVRVARVLEPIELGLPNPAGLAFSPRDGTLLVVTRSPGTPSGSATDIELVTLFEDRAGTVRIAAAVPDPVNMAFDGSANRLLIFDSSKNELIEILARADGGLDPQTLQRIDARGLGIEDPQGLTVDPISGRLFILDAAGPRIVSVEPRAQLDIASPLVGEIDLARSGLSDLRGLAFDPSSGHLHVLDPSTQALYELSETGDIVATRDLSAFDFRNPQGMTFGPSGDTTDDPSQLSLYLADSGVGGGTGGSFAESGRITELSFEQPVAVSTALFATEVASLVRTTDTWRFNPPSPDPAGITYLSHLNHLLISDSEVNEMRIFEDVNLFEITLSGSLRETGNSLTFDNQEPTGATYNPTNRHLFLSKDDGNAVYEVDPGSDGIYGTSDDNVTHFDTGSFGSGDAEGVTYDFSEKVLFIVDGEDREVYRVSPGSNGLFDGIDDKVTHFDTHNFGLEDPEGIAYDSDHGHLYIVGKPATRVFHVTTTGTLLREIDISAANATKPAGLAYAPSSVNPGQMSLYIVDRNVDNNSNSSENDGELYEFSLPPFSGNTLPTVTITAPTSGSTFDQGDPVTFTGTATDSEDGNLTSALTWSSNLDGEIGSGGSFSTSGLSLGTHTITAYVTDSGGQQGLDAITVMVNCPDCNFIDARVAASSDDAEEGASGGMDLTSSDLELTQETTTQTIGIRFNSVSIPRGVTITNAYIQFQVDEANSEATSLIIEGEATDNAATFSNTSGNISTRGRTAHSESWSPPPWTTLGEAGPDQQTPNIASIIQDIVDRTGWSSGNSLAIIITGTGKRVAESYDGTSGAAPLLHVDYSTEAPSDNPPTATDDAGTVTTGATLTVPAPGVMINDSDPDGDALTVTTTPVTGPSHGSLTLNADGSYSYTHDGGPTTSDSFVYEVCDAGPLCDTATVHLTITEANDPPSAVDDTGTLAEGSSLNVAAPGVLTNDSDPDGDALTVTTTPVTAPSHGVLTLNADGSYSYDHDGSETTSDSFVYEVCDAGLLCATATVNLTITPVNDPPILVNDTGSLSEGGTLNVPTPGVLANDSDPEGGTLTVTTTPVAGPSFGTLTLNANGSYSYTHTGQSTSDSFVYEACDAGTLCATATVNLVITGGVYVLTPTYSTSGGKNSDRHLEVTATLVDSGGNPVAGASVSVTIQGPTPGGGTATTDASGTASFRITNAAPGTYTTVVTAVTAAGLTWDGNTPSNSFTK